MAYLSDNVLDASLEYISTNATHLYICSQEPTTLTEATTTYALGSKAGPTFGAIQDREEEGGGRELPVDAITGGAVTDTGTATHYALVSNTELLAAGAISNPQVVTSGNSFNLAAFTIGIPDAV